MGDPDPNGEPAPFSPEQMAWLTQNLRPASVAGTGGTSSQLPPGRAALRLRKLAAPRPLRPRYGLAYVIFDPSAAARQTLPTFADAHDATAPQLFTSQLAATLPIFDADNTTAAIPHASGGPTNRLPARLIARIENLEFIELYELLQEAWLPDTTADATTQAITLRLPRRSTPVSDISVWVECYCLMASVLGARYPASASNLWAYLRRIVRQAAASRTLSWAVEDQTLYNEAFSGRAKPVARCKVCLSEHHSVDACPDAPRFLLGQPDAPASRLSSQEICRRYNEERCFASSCKYRHACSNCSGNHPATNCGPSRARAAPTHPYPRN
eukprot:Em0009g85a